jgi:uncharacterized protein YdiU (UPF0061 family)
MRNNNPLVIPRNHKVEEALKAAEHNNLKPFNNLFEILSKPYTEQKGINDYQSPSISNVKYQTFCGT